MNEFEQDDAVTVEPQAWRLRPMLLTLVGAVAALAVQQLLDYGRPLLYSPVPIDAWRIALATGILTAAAAFGFGLERIRRRWTLVFALVVGAIAGLVFYWNGDPGWGFWSDWRAASLFLSIAIAVPLFQTARDAGEWRYPYAQVHGHAWTNVVLWFACWLFTGIVFALAWLLSGLFDLIGIRLIHELLDKHWFCAVLIGGAFGGGLGLLRERDRVVRLLQRVVTAVLSVLAPVLGAGLVIFLVSLPFTGLSTLWEATRSTTPILLTCVIGALILANAVIGNGEEDEAGNPVLRWGAIALAASALPLAMIAAVATGLRIGQYGLSPDRLWALVFVMLASAYGLAYLVCVVRGRREWARLARPANLRLAFIICAVALFLATPLLSFNTLATADQLARLKNGRTTPDKFDWAALAFDFGDPGKRALKVLAASSNQAIAARAKDAASKDNRYAVVDIDRNAKEADALSRRLRVLPTAIPVPHALLEKLTDWNACGQDAKRACTVLYATGATEAVAVQDRCVEEMPDQGHRSMFNDCVARYRWDGKEWLEGDAIDRKLDQKTRGEMVAAMKQGRVEVRTVPRRQVFIGGVPVGNAFE